MRTQAGGSLKHSTGRMKMQHMRHVLDFREKLEKDQAKERQRKIEVTQVLYCRLIELDPVGGEAWFDDNENVPEFGTVDARIAILEKRISELEEDK